MSDIISKKATVQEGTLLDEKETLARRSSFTAENVGASSVTFVRRSSDRPRLWKGHSPSN